jgi:hypothetical protein
MQPTSIYRQPEPHEFGLPKRGRSVLRDRPELHFKPYELGARPVFTGFFDAAPGICSPAAKYDLNSAGKLEISVVERENKQIGSDFRVEEIAGATLTLQEG